MKLVLLCCLFWIEIGFVFMVLLKRGLMKCEYKEKSLYINSTNQFPIKHCFELGNFITTAGKSIFDSVKS